MDNYDFSTKIRGELEKKHLSQYLNNVFLKEIKLNYTNMYKSIKYHYVKLVFQLYLSLYYPTFQECQLFQLLDMQVT